MLLQHLVDEEPAGAEMNPYRQRRALQLGLPEECPALEALLLEVSLHFSICTVDDSIWPVCSNNQLFIRNNLVGK